MFVKFFVILYLTYFFNLPGRVSKLLKQNEIIFNLVRLQKVFIAKI